MLCQSILSLSFHLFFDLGIDQYFLSQRNVAKDLLKALYEESSKLDIKNTPLEQYVIYQIMLQSSEFHHRINIENFPAYLVREAGENTLALVEISRKIQGTASSVRLESGFEIVYHAY